jgi:hypothetical protein
MRSLAVVIEMSSRAIKKSEGFHCVKRNTSKQFWKENKDTLYTMMKPDEEEVPPPPPNEQQGGVPPPIEKEGETLGVPSFYDDETDPDNEDEASAVTEQTERTEHLVRPSTVVSYSSTKVLPPSSDHQLRAPPAREQRPPQFQLPPEQQSSHRTRSISRIGAVYKKSGGVIHTVDSAHGIAADKVDVPQEDTTWNEVYQACCVHSALEWVHVTVLLLMLVLLLYLFLVGLDLLGTAFKVVGGCTAGSMLGSDTNPLASVMIGIVATALLQSSSTTTSIVVSLVSGGLDVKQAIYIVMVRASCSIDHRFRF